MLQSIFGKRSDDDESSTLEKRRHVTGSSSAELAASLLCAPTALMQLELPEARTVVSYMNPRKIAAGTTFIAEGDERTDFMVLVIEGEVTVESIVVSRVAPITVNVIGPGSVIGEMGLVDGEPRSASCTASTDLRCAILTRESLEDLIQAEPAAGAKFMMAISLRIAARMRETADKLKLYAQLTQTMQQEIDRALPTPGHYIQPNG
jgi:CRP/FNR family transcriptional regulator, cyclic AMP receptor protein